MFKEFMSECFDNAVLLKKKFQITESRPWTALDVMNELNVQLGHYAYTVTNDNFCKEQNRDISDKKDEIADILLQLCALCEKLNIDKKHIKLMEVHYMSEEKSIIGIQILVGQLSESIMELEGYRHDKERYGYSSKMDFIVDRISRTFSIVFSIGKRKGYNLIEAFITMCSNANDFLIKFEEEHKNV